MLIHEYGTHLKEVIKQAKGSQVFNPMKNLFEKGKKKWKLILEQEIVPNLRAIFKAKIIR